MAKNHVLLYDTSIYYAFEISQQYEVTFFIIQLLIVTWKLNSFFYFSPKIKDILEPKTAQEISEKTELRLAADLV